ncbi:MAG TPA: hypothetical protein VNM40_04285 [Candidatus Paceibacterota bacterium]|nr:hypothetical protein [Candidatus Paceibacterota bacterium]
MLAARVETRAAVATTVATATVLAFAFGAPATGYTFANGSFNLKIDSTATYNGVLQPKSTWALKNLNPGSDKFFNLKDVRPGDQGEATISFHVNKDSWICLDFENLKERENGRNEPEGQEDDSGGSNSGELADGTEFFAWYDDGDNIFEIGEKPIFGTSTDKQAATITLNNKTYALADSIAGDAFKANKTSYIGIQWCAGDMQVNLATAVITCDASALGNEAQTDSFSVDIGFRAVPSKDNKKFTCIKKNTKCEWPKCDGKCNTNVKVDNNGFIISNTSSSANTGGNSAGGAQGGNGGSGSNGAPGGNGGSVGSGGTVTTGNATSSAHSINVINRTEIRTR